MRSPPSTRMRIAYLAAVAATEPDAPTVVPPAPWFGIYDKRPAKGRATPSCTRSRRWPATPGTPTSSASFNEDGTPGLTITTSDVYDWAPGGFFIVHMAFGRAGSTAAAPSRSSATTTTTGRYTSHLYDSQGNVVVSSLVANGSTWTYQGDTTRSTVEFSDDDHVQTVLHERTDDGAVYKPSMRVTLVKVD